MDAVISRGIHFLFQNYRLYVNQKFKKEAPQYFDVLMCFFF